jgi:hypothetical protein
MFRREREIVHVSVKIGSLMVSTPSEGSYYISWKRRAITGQTEIKSFGKEPIISFHKMIPIECNFIISRKKMKPKLMQFQLIYFHENKRQVCGSWNIDLSQIKKTDFYQTVFSVCFYLIGDFKIDVSILRDHASQSEEIAKNYVMRLIYNHSILF